MNDELPDRTRQQPCQLMEDEHGLVFAHLDSSEAEFLYEEIFVRESYMQCGIRLSRRGAPVVVDVGANIGLFSLYCLRLNPRSRLIAIEPSPATFTLLENNLAGVLATFSSASDFSQAECHQVALCDREGVSTLHCFSSAPGESSRHPRERAMQRRRLRSALAHAEPELQAPAAAQRANGRARPARRGVDASSNKSSDTSSDAGADALPFARSGDCSDMGTPVRCTTSRLDALLRACGVSRVSLLKIDVEGDELSVLRGLSASALARIDQVAVEVHDLNGRLRRVICLLRRHGFSATARAQGTATVRGYRMVVPPQLNLWYVYARRAPARKLREWRKRAAADSASQVRPGHNH